MKLALVLGRGVEGAGVSKYTKELSDWLLENDIDQKIFASVNKRWPRAKSHQFNTDISYFNTNDLDKLKKELDEYDYVLLMSIPAVKGFDEDFSEGFYQAIANTSASVIFFQHDHKKQSLNRNYRMIDFCKVSDLIFVHSFDSEFVKYLKEMTEINKNSIMESFSSFEKSSPFEFRKLEVGINFDKLKPFIKDFSSKKRRVTYLGRFATFKDPSRLYRLHPYLREHNIISELIGIERSIGALDSMFRYKNDNRDYASRHMIDMIDCTNPKKFMIEREDQTSDLPYVYGPYDNQEGLEQISESLFGASFYHLPKVKKSDHVEYSMLEIVGVGNLPIFDKSWAETTNIRSTDQHFVEMSDSMVFAEKDGSNFEEVAHQVNDMMNDQSKFNKSLEKVYDILNRYYSHDFCFQRLINTIKEN